LSWGISGYSGNFLLVCIRSCIVKYCVVFSYYDLGSAPPLPVQAQQTGRVKTHFDIFMIPTPSLSKEAKNE
ncbi:MAG: hypothetical protein CO106_12425, partial [Deltaproteobacteria bacterium CG_4_9_14_3_um_filter_44_9]